MYEITREVYKGIAKDLNINPTCKNKNTIVKQDNTIRKRGKSILMYF